MTNILQDLRFALRQLRRAPGFTLGVTLILALGIGANAAMFTVLRATLLRPLNYTRSGDLLTTTITTAQGKPAWARLPDFQAWRDRSHTLLDVAYFRQNAETYLIGGTPSSASEQVVNATEASANLFTMLGAAPALGRTFTVAEQQPGHEQVVVLSDAVWRSQFHADRGILGATIRLEDKPVTVIGVMPPGFRFPAEIAEPQVWQPAALTSEAVARTPFSAIYTPLLRRRPGTSLAEVSAELNALQTQLAPLYSGSMGPELVPARASALSFRESLNTPVQRSAVLGLFGAVLALWLIASTNVASLMLARTAARRRELAVRSALGATRWRLLRQALLEGLLLSLLGGALGLLLANITLRLFAHRLTAELGPDLALHADARVLLALFALSLASALLFGLVPALLGTRFPVEQALRQDGAQSGTGRSQHRLQKILIVSELALTLVLLVSCGLLLRTVLALRHVPLGFRTEHVYVIQPNLPSYKYRNLDPNALVYRPLLDRVRSLPGVQTAAITTVAPLATGFNTVLQLTLGSGNQKEKYTDSIVARMRASGPELQQVLGFRMLRGRYFDSTDTAASQPVAVVNQTFARLYHEGTGLNGKDISEFTLGEKDRQFKIIGVIDDFHQAGVAEAAEPELDFNAAQMRPTDPFYQATLKAHAEIALRSSRPPASLLPELRHALTATNPDLADAKIQTMDQIVDDAIGSQLLAAHLLETLGALALLIALAGLYSLLTYLVTLRTRELGLRLALGAQRSDILSLVLRNAANLLLTGIAAGLALSLAAARLLRTFLFGVHPHDPLTLIVAPLLLLAVGLLAAWIPARRAAHLEPTIALRSE